MFSNNQCGHFLLMPLFSKFYQNQEKILITFLTGQNKIFSNLIRSNVKKYLFSSQKLHQLISGLM